MVDIHFLGISDTRYQISSLLRNFITYLVIGFQKNFDFCVVLDAAI